MLEILMAVAFTLRTEHPHARENLLSYLPPDLLISISEYYSNPMNLTQLNNAFKNDINVYLWGENPTNEQKMAIQNYAQEKKMQLSEKKKHIATTRDNFVRWHNLFYRGHEGYGPTPEETAYAIRMDALKKNIVGVSEAERAEVDLALVNSCVDKAIADLIEQYPTDDNALQTLRFEVLKNRVEKAMAAK